MRSRIEIIGMWSGIQCGKSLNIKSFIIYSIHFLCINCFLFGVSATFLKYTSLLVWLLWIGTLSADKGISVNNYTGRRHCRTFFQEKQSINSQNPWHKPRFLTSHINLRSSTENKNSKINVFFLKINCRLLLFETRHAKNACFRSCAIENCYYCAT